MEVQIASNGDLGQARTSYIATETAKPVRVSAAFQPAPSPTQISARRVPPHAAHL